MPPFVISNYQGRSWISGGRQTSRVHDKATNCSARSRPRSDRRVGRGLSRSNCYGLHSAVALSLVLCSLASHHKASNFCHRSRTLHTSIPSSIKLLQRACIRRPPAYDLLPRISQIDGFTTEVQSDGCNKTSEVGNEIIDPQQGETEPGDVEAGLTRTA